MRGARPGYRADIIDINFRDFSHYISISLLLLLLFLMFKMFKMSISVGSAQFPSISGTPLVVVMNIKTPPCALPLVRERTPIRSA